MSPSSLTSFERRRGVTAIRVRSGVAHVQVTGLPRETLMSARIAGLDRISRAGAQIDFLKLTSDGFTFVLTDQDCSRALDTLKSSGFEASASSGRTIITVHCVNIRDESGIVAKIAETTTATGARIEQMGDSHDCILMVVESEAALRAAAGLRKAFGMEASDAD